jgi:hypothetical protein
MAVLSITKAGISAAGKSRSLTTARATVVPLPQELGADLWLDASDTSTITESGGAVSQWTNKGSLGDFTQATGAVQPTTGATTLNGRNVIDFASDYLTAANTNEWKFLHDGTDWIMACVARFGTASDPNAVYGLLGSSTSSTSFVGAWLAYDDRAEFSLNDMFRGAVNRGGSPPAVSFASANGFLAANAAAVLSAYLRPSNATAANRLAYHLNDGAAISPNTQTGTPSTSNPSYALQIGASGNNTLAMTGYIAEIVVVSGANATETNRAALTNYLNTKWGVF